MTKKELAINLSKMEVFSAPDINEEQYPTDSEIAGDVLWTAYLTGDIEGKVVADLGAGTGILGIGCLLLGAKKVFFVEKDLTAINVLKQNLEMIELENYEIINTDIRNFKEKVDTVVQNPPFGTQEKHADTFFLDKAVSIAKAVYTFHKAETKQYIDKYIAKSGFKAINYLEFNFPLKKSMDQHRKKVRKIRVGCWCIKK